MPHPRRKPSVLLLLGWKDAETLETIGDYAREHDWQLEMRPYFTGALPGNWQGDGILYSKGTQQHIDELVVQQATRCPIVALNANLPPGLDVPVVTSNDFEAGRMAALHLIEQGFRNFTFESPALGAVVTARKRGFEEALIEHGFRLHPSDTAIDAKPAASWQTQRQDLEMRLRQLPPQVGILALDDLVAVDVIEAAVAVGRRVPDDLAVIGLGNLKAVCQYSTLPITSIDLRMGEIARRGAELLGQLMQQGPTPATPLQIAPGNLIVRESSGTTLVRDPRLAKAIAYIQAQLDRPLTLEQIAEAGGVSRRTLYQLFRVDLGLAPADYLRRRRIQLAERLLSEQPDLTQQDAAQLAGFACTRTFKRCMQKR